MKYAIVIAAVLLIRLPFVNQAITGDDVYYLASAEHAQIDPLHPNHTHYVFQGKDVDFRGYPHPPLNAWALAGLLSAFGGVYEVPYHAAYILFSLIAALAMFSLAKRFSPQPLWATLLFLAVPAFVVNGNSLESDVPFLAFWMAGIAAFVAGRMVFAIAFLALASLGAIQVVLAVPILAVYLWLNGRRDTLGWAAVVSPICAVASWQLCEYFSTGQFPVLVTAGYLQSYNLGRFHMKLMNAAGLAVHSCFLICPFLLPPAIWSALKRRDADTRFLAAWIAIFFAGACVFFYSGSARYLLPMAAPVALLASRLRPAWLAGGFALQMTLSLLLAVVNYQHWEGYRKFAQSLSAEMKTRHVWANAEWGLRHYLEADGALPVHEGERIPAGDLVVSSELAYPVPFSHGGAVPVPIAQAEIRPWIPLRLIALDSHSGYSTVDKGLLPFGISRGPIDRMRAEVMQAHEPALEYLPMNASQAEEQIVSGIFNLESGLWRWTSGTATVTLKSPASPMPVHVALYIPDNAPARTVQVFLDQKLVAAKTFPGPGTYTIDTAAQSPANHSVLVTLTVDKTVTVPGDTRKLGLVLTGIGFRK